MKKLSKLLALAAGLTSLFFAACSDVSENPSGTMSAGIQDKTNNAKEYNVSFAAADGSTLELETLGINSNKVSARTIVADAVDISDGVTFYIWGKDEVNTTTNPVNPKEVTFVANADSTTTGTVVLDYTASKYFFVLAAVETSNAPASLSEPNIRNAAIYIGYANVDLRNGDTIKFYISSDGLDGGGSFNLKIKTDTSWSAEHIAKVGDSSKYTITAGLYDRATDTALSSPTLDTVTNSEFITADGHSWTTSDVTPGTYNFVVKFAGPNSKVYEYSDVIIILPNRSITKTVEIPDIIEYAPLSPTAFKAAYIAPDVATAEDYNILLQWTDNSKNERYFEIEYVDVSAQGASYVNEAMETAFANWREVEDDPSDATYATKKAAADTAWGTAITNLTAKVKKLDYAFYGNSDQNWVAGSLQKNNQNIIVSLALGKRYIFRISAVNDAGISDNYSYATFKDDLEWIIYDSDFTSGTYTASKFATKKAQISAAATYGKFTYDADANNNIPAGVTQFYADSDTDCSGSPSGASSLLSGTAYRYKNPSDNTTVERFTYTVTSNIPAGVTKFYTDTTNVLPAAPDLTTVIEASSLVDDTEYSYEATPAVASSHEDDISLTANLYRLTYHLNGGTYNNAAGSGVTGDIVEYKCQGDIELRCPKNPIVTGTGAEYPQLKNASGKRWTAWKQGSIAGTNYGTATTKGEGSPAVNFTYYDPGDYTGYANFDLFASFNLSNASVVAYNDSEYDIKDTEGTTSYAAHTVIEADKTSSEEFYTRTGSSEPYTYTKVTDNSGLTVDTTVYTKSTTGGTAAIAITSPTTGVTKSTNHYYTVVSSTAKVTFKYQGTVEYSSLKAVVKRGGSVVASGNFSTSKTYDFETKQLPLGTYIVMVYGEYKGHTYQYSITVVLEDA